ncbi:phosphodiesterase, partial [Candidatus Roizmanbacteria bacterium CG09_land_8_20_14_0_10_41_9]
MISERSIEYVNGSKFGSQFRRPLYESYGFASIPRSIPALLGEGELALPKDVLGALPRSYNKVALFFFDSFGWRFYEQFSTHPLIDVLTKEGAVSKLTSQFPSTTAANLTTINTGKPVGEHGIYEWNYYEPVVDSVIASLPFAFPGDNSRGSLAQIGVEPHDIFPNDNIYQELSKKGIVSHIFLHGEIAYSPYSSVLTRGAVIHLYNTLKEGLANLDTQLKTDKRGYYFFYFGNFDSVCHEYGPDSKEAEAEGVAILNTIERAFFDTKKLKDILFLMAADHGQVQTPENQCHYINIELSGIVPMIKTTADGQPIVPAGSPRDFFLHIRDESLLDAQSLLQN